MNNLRERIVSFEDVYNTRRVISEFPNPQVWTLELARKFLEFEKEFQKFFDELSPGELRAVPGVGQVWDLSMLPRGTHKIYLAARLAKTYFEEAQDFLKNPRSGVVFDEPVIIGSGNAADSLAWLFQNLPVRPKIVMDGSVSSVLLDLLKSYKASIYTADLGMKALSRDEISRLANSDFSRSIELTGVAIDTWRPELQVPYLPIARKVFGLNNIPNIRIYLPAGSQILFENFLRMQIDDWKNEEAMSIVGVAPEDSASHANMLTSKFLPFQVFGDKKIAAWKERGMTGADTGIIKVPERYIIQAKEILSASGVRTGFSGAAGLAGKLFTGQDGLVINTGVGVGEILV